VKFVNNFPPGGPSDIIARSLSAELQKSLKQTFIVENKPGAAGNIGAEQVAKSTADGTTVLLGIDTVFTVNPFIYKRLAFKPADFKPVMVIASSGLLVGVNPGTGFKTLGELVAAGRQGKGLNFSSAGSGSPGHLAVELFKDATGMKITQVPYKGNSPAVNALLAAAVDGGALATPGRQRSRLAPEVPTVAEAGFKGLEQEVLYVAMVPAATPDAAVQTLAKAMTDALAQPDIRQRLIDLDLQAEGLTGAAATQRLTALAQHYERVIRATGMHVE